VLDFFHPTPDDLFDLHYPVMHYPTKVTSLNLGKTPQYTGQLQGIKGQYLIFDDQTVFNVRTYEGFEVRLQIDK
jgi:hypothetical protein